MSQLYKRHEYYPTQHCKRNNDNPSKIGQRDRGDVEEGEGKPTTRARGF